MTITRDDVLEAFSYACRNGARINIDDRLGNTENYNRLMRAGDDAGQDALARETFVLCDCCSHPS